MTIWNLEGFFEDRDASERFSGSPLLLETKAGVFLPHNGMVGPRL